MYNTFTLFEKAQTDDFVQKLKDSIKKVLDEDSDDLLSFKNAKINLSRQNSPLIFCNFIEDKEIIFLDYFKNDIHKLDDVVHSTSTPSKEKRDSKKSENLDFDVTGSPLKCTFLSLNESLPTFDEPFVQPKQQYSFNGLDLNIGRDLCSHIKCIFDDPDFCENVCPIFVTCDGQDPQKTSFIGFCHKEGKLKLVIINAEGPTHIPEEFPSIEHFVSMVSGTRIDKISSHVDASYEVLSRDNNKGSLLVLTSSWKGPSSLLSSPSLYASNILTTEIDSSDSRSLLYNIYSEMELIRNFINGLKSGKMTFIGNGMNNLDTLFKEMNEKDSIDPEICSLDKMIENSFSCIRKKIDFSDLVWDALKGCESFYDLQRAFEYIFEAITSGKIRPRFLIRNQTEIGVISGLLMSGQSEVPKLNDSKPLSMLIETGLEKLKRDYISIFQIGSLATSDKTTSFIDWNASKDDYDLCFKKLKQLDVALQVVILMKHHLNLPHPVLVHSISQVFAELLKSPDSKSFTFPLQTSMVDKVYSSLLPMSWNLHLNSNENDSLVNELHLFISRDPYTNASSHILSDISTHEENRPFFVSTVRSTLC